MKGEEKKLASAGAVFRAYFARVREHPVLLTFIFVGGIIVQGATLFAPLYLRQFFNLLAALAANEEAVSALFGILWIVAALWLLELAGSRIQHGANISFSAKVMAKLLADAFSYLIEHSYNFFTSNFAGSLTHRVSKFGRSFETLFDSIVISFIPTFLFVCGAIIVLFFRHPMLGGALLAWTIAFICFQYYVARLRQPARAARAEADTRVTGALADAISNQSTISLFSGATFERKLFGGVIDRWRKATLHSWWADHWIWAGIGFFIVLIETGLLFGAVILWRRGLVTIGDFVLIQAYLITVFDRLAGINRELRRFFDAYADAAEMVAILEEPHGVKDKKDAGKLKVIKGEIWFDDVTFGFYDDSILKNFNLKISGGERVALVGPSGAGKTTVTKLLLRLYEVK